jgi:hypothetical protein
VWEDFQRFLDYLIKQYGIGPVMLAPFGTIAVLAGAGVITGGAVSLAATGLGLFVAVVFISALYVQLRGTRQLLVQRARVLARYTDRFARSFESYAFQIVDWNESVIVGKRGDTVLEKWVTIEVGDEELYSVWSWVYARDEVSAAERRRVRIEARGFDENGTFGARYDVTEQWEGNRVKLFIHFEQPARAHQTVRVWIRWEWPRYYSSLLDGDIAVVEWLMHRPAKRVSTRIVFDRACKLGGELRVTPHQECPVPTQHRTPDDGIEIRIAYFDVTPGAKIGFTLDGSRLRR